MADFNEFIGLPTGKGTLVVERAPIGLFARAVGDESDVYQNADAAQGRVRRRPRTADLRVLDPELGQVGRAPTA